MYPMSLYESTESSGEISFLELFDNKDLDIDGVTSKLSIEELIMVACRGGWPDSLSVKSDKAKLLIAKDYLNKVCNEDISSIDDVQRNPELARLILRSYARNLCTLAKKSAMLEDVKAEMETTPHLSQKFATETIPCLFPQQPQFNLLASFVSSL